jgi:hypothetical protein
MILELNLQSPHNPDGTPREDLPTGEVLAWNGKGWANGKLNIRGTGKVWLLDNESYSYVQLQNVLRFAPLPTIIK